MRTITIEKALEWLTGHPDGLLAWNEWRRPPDHVLPSLAGELMKAAAVDRVAVVIRPYLEAIA